MQDEHIPSEREGGAFDTRTIIRDKRTGAVIAKQPYRLHVVAGKEYFERPVGSGNLFFANGEKAGQVRDGKVRPGDPHMAWRAPSEIERDAEIQKRDQELAQLKAELRSIQEEQGEKEKKVEEPVEAVSKEEKKPKHPYFPGKKKETKS